jgi:hypothetical protein
VLQSDLGFKRNTLAALQRVDYLKEKKITVLSAVDLGG